jgi:hypothetical protein
MTYITTNSLLFRHVHPKFYDAGFKSRYLAFFPFAHDAGKLSVYDGEMINPEGCYFHYTQQLKFQSVGVWGLSQKEVKSVGLTVQADPLPNSPAHALLDFGKKTKQEYKKIAKKLANFAEMRKKLYPVDS